VDHEALIDTLDLGRRPGHRAVGADRRPGEERLLHVGAEQHHLARLGVDLVLDPDRPAAAL
jgi:hypothetical protein